MKLGLVECTEHYLALGAGHYDVSKKERVIQGFKEAFEQTKVLNDGTLSFIQKWNFLLVIQHVRSCLCKG